VARVKSRVRASRFSSFRSHHNIDHCVMSHAIPYLTRLPSEIWRSIFRSVVEKDIDLFDIHRRDVAAFATCLTVSRHWKVRTHSVYIALSWTDCLHAFDRRLPVL
jgi:hypothetical protein